MRHFVDVLLCENCPTLIPALAAAMQVLVQVALENLEGQVPLGQLQWMPLLRSDVRILVPLDRQALEPEVHLEGMRRLRLVQHRC